MWWWVNAEITVQNLNRIEVCGGKCWNCKETKLRLIKEKLFLVTKDTHTYIHTRTQVSWRRSIYVSRRANYLYVDAILGELNVKNGNVQHESCAVNIKRNPESKHVVVQGHKQLWWIWLKKRERVTQNGMLRKRTPQYCCVLIICERWPGREETDWID